MNTRTNNNYCKYTEAENFCNQNDTYYDDTDNEV